MAGEVSQRCEGRPASQSAVTIGHAVRGRGAEVLFDPEDLIGRGQGLIVGGTGVGKTRLGGAIIQSMLERFAEDPTAPRPWVIDHKGDLARHAYDCVSELAGRLPAEKRERLLDSFVVVQPFSDEALVPLQVLASDGGAEVDPELQSDDVASLFGRLAGASLGIKQDALA